MENMPPPDVSLFLASSVHDMKNSISVLIDTAKNILVNSPPQESESYQGMVQMLYETQRINDNLIQLLTLYKLGNNLYPFSADQEDIGELAVVMASYVKPLLSSKNIALEIDVDQDCYWDLDADLVTGVVVHALNNAAHYTKDTIRLVAREVDGVLEVRVEDNGVGFPQRMVDEGIAAMRGIDYSTSSTGLGLYFAAVVAKMHHTRTECGSIRLENGGSLGGGCFVLRLP